MFQPRLKNEDVKTQISGLLKNEYFQLPHLWEMKIDFLKQLKTEGLKTPLKNVKQMKTMSCAGSPSDEGADTDLIYNFCLPY